MGSQGRPHTGDDVQFLVTSETRVRLLESLSESPRGPGEICSDSGISRASLSRNVKYLKEKGWARETGDGIAITATGSLALRNYRRFARSMRAVDELEDFLNWVPPSDAKNLDLEKLEGSDVVTPTQLQPMTPTEELRSVVSDAGRARAVVPYMVPSLKGAMMEGLQEGMELEAVITSGLADLVRSEYRDILEQGNVTLYARDDDLPIGMWLVDDVLSLLAHDEEGLPRTLVTNDSPKAVRCGEGVYEDLKRGAERLEPDR